MLMTHHSIASSLGSSKKAHLSIRWKSSYAYGGINGNSSFPARSIEPNEDCYAEVYGPEFLALSESDQRRFRSIVKAFQRGSSYVPSLARALRSGKLHSRNAHGVTLFDMLDYMRAQREAGARAHYQVLKS